MSNLTISKVVVVEFPDGTREYYGSLAAVFERHSPQEIGYILQSLYNKKIGETPLDTGKCIISKQPLYRLKMQNNTRR